MNASIFNPNEGTFSPTACHDSLLNEHRYKGPPKSARSVSKPVADPPAVSASSNNNGTFNFANLSTAEAGVTSAEAGNVSATSSASGIYVAIPTPEPRQERNSAYSISGDLSSSNPTLYSFPSSSGTGNSPAQTNRSSVSGDVYTSTGPFEGGIRIHDSLLDAFYACFYPAHPVVIPARLFAQDPFLLPPHLRDVLKFIGSHFVPEFPSETLRAAATAILYQNVQGDGYMVQSLLFLAMGLFARFELEEGVSALQKGIGLALSLGMNCKEFSVSQGQGKAVFQESWKRTWWDLYVVDGLVSAIDGIGWVTQLRDIPSDVPLPCECLDYGTGQPPLLTRTILDMQDRVFDQTEYPWSSFAYEIESVRLMHNVLRSNLDIRSHTDADIEALDASLSSFWFSMPQYKRELTAKDGKTDEVLFATHATMYWATILLHRPRSHLVFIPKPYQTACSQTELIRTPVMPYATHTSKALHAANEISKMTSLRVPLSVHTPCFICAISKAAIVHLPAYSLETNPQDAATIKERLQLAINALNTMGEFWPMAKMVKMQVAQYAREALSVPQMLPSAAVPGSGMNRVDLTAFDADTWPDLLGSFGAGALPMPELPIPPGYGV